MPPETDFSVSELARILDRLAAKIDALDGSMTNLALLQRELHAELSNLKDDTAALARLVRDGNGQEPLTAKVFRLEEQFKGLSSKPTPGLNWGKLGDWWVQILLGLIATGGGIVIAAIQFDLLGNKKKDQENGAPTQNLPPPPPSDVPWFEGGQDQSNSSGGRDAANFANTSSLGPPIPPSRR